MSKYLITFRLFQQYTCITRCNFARDGDITNSAETFYTVSVVFSPVQISPQQIIPVGHGNFSAEFVGSSSSGFYFDRAPLMAVQFYFLTNEKLELPQEGGSAARYYQREGKSSLSIITPFFHGMHIFFHDIRQDCILFTIR